MKNLQNILSEKEFSRFVSKNLPLSKYVSGEDSRFIKGTTYADSSATRCFMVYNEIARNLSETKRIIDLGFFPGVLIRELKLLFGDQVKCSGVGLGINDEFREFMKPYMEKCVNAELDDFYLKSKERVKLPLEDSSFDVVVATEVLEHLISPLGMIAETSRILRKGGKCIVTTPNVSHAGAIFRLATGRSNYELLKSSPMYRLNDDWRGHIRFYDKSELRQLFDDAGMEMSEHKYYHNWAWHRNSTWSLPKKAILSLVNTIGPKIYRGEHFAVFKKK